MRIPSDLENYLNEQSSLSYDTAKCECGMVVLKNPTELETEELDVELHSSHYPSKQQLDEGPWGSYYIKAISLIKSCDDYEPDFILLWLPHDNQYGTFDIHHRTLLIFGDARWSDIVKNPLPYINAQWYDYEHEISAHFDPTAKYEIVYEK